MPRYRILSRAHLESLPIHISQGTSSALFVTPPGTITLGTHEIPITRSGIGLRKRHKRRNGRRPDDSPDLFLDVAVPPSPRYFDSDGPLAPSPSGHRHFMIACRRGDRDELYPLELIAIARHLPSRRIALMPDPLVPDGAEPADGEPCPAALIGRLAPLAPAPVEDLLKAAIRLVTDTIAPACDPFLVSTLHPPLALRFDLTVETFAAMVDDILAATTTNHLAKTAEHTIFASACLNAAHGKGRQTTYVSDVSNAGREAIALLMHHYRPSGCDFDVAIAKGNKDGDAPGERVECRRATIMIDAFTAGSALGRAARFAALPDKLHALSLRIASEDPAVGRRFRRIVEAIERP